MNLLYDTHCTILRYLEALFNYSIFSYRISINHYISSYFKLFTYWIGYKQIEQPLNQPDNTLLEKLDNRLKTGNTLKKHEVNMITIGIDSVDIERFTHWTRFTHKKLSRLYSDEEIAYSLSQPTKTAERLAVRFAAKEAFYKAIAELLPSPAPFITIGKKCCITLTRGNIPQLSVCWSDLGLSNYAVKVSLTHTSHIATAIVTIEKY